MDSNTNISSDKLRQIAISHIDVASDEFLIKYVCCMCKYSKTPEMRSYWSMIYKWVYKELKK